MKQYRIPWDQVEEDGDVYWAPKYLNDMGLPWSCRQDTRVVDGMGVFAVFGSAAQFAELEQQPDVTPYGG